MGMTTSTVSQLRPCELRAARQQRAQLLELGERVRAATRALLLADATGYDVNLILTACDLEHHGQPEYFHEIIRREHDRC